MIERTPLGLLHHRHWYDNDLTGMAGPLWQLLCRRVLKGNFGAAVLSLERDEMQQGRRGSEGWGRRGFQNELGGGAPTFRRRLCLQP